MVLALLAGTKTQTRRIVKPQPPPAVGLVTLEETSEGLHCVGYRGPSQSEWVEWDLSPVCRFGEEGDRLWVKETWRTEAETDRLAPRELSTFAPIFYETENPGDPQPFGKCRPSIFMMRHMSRLTLEVTEVRVERLQSISADDARAEGIDRCLAETLEPVEVYRSLWESINGPGSWAANPWVWVVSFRVAP